jgi:hypothetical protein
MSPNFAIYISFIPRTEDFARAILGKLDSANLSSREVTTVHSAFASARLVVLISPVLAADAPVVREGVLPLAVARAFPRFPDETFLVRAPFQG